MKHKSHDAQRGTRGEGSVIWSKSDQRYSAELTIGYDPHGRRIRKRVRGVRGDDSAAEKARVKERLARLLLEHPAPKYGERRIVQTITLGDFAQKWLDERDSEAPSRTRNYARSEPLSVAAHGAYKWAIDGHIVPSRLASKQLAEITNDDLRGFLRGLKLGDGGKHKVRTVLCAMFKDAHSVAKLRADNPAENLPAFNGIARETPHWSVDESLAFLAHARRSEHFPMFLAMIIGALGPAEVFGLRWKNVNFDGATITVEQNLTECGGRLVVGATKTKFRKRTFSLPAVLVKELRKRYQRAKPNPTDYVFTAPDGGPIRRTTFSSRVWAPLLKRAKVPAIPLYGIRHSAASLMAAMGVPLLVASRQLGHSNIATTANRYSHLFEETSKGVAGKFADLFKDL